MIIWYIPEYGTRFTSEDDASIVYIRGNYEKRRRKVFDSERERSKDEPTVSDLAVRVRRFGDSMHREGRQGTKIRACPARQASSPIVSGKSRSCSNRPWSFARRTSQRFT